MPSAPATSATSTNVFVERLGLRVGLGRRNCGRLLCRGLAILKTCPTCGNYNPYAERYPSLATVQQELALIKLEKRHQQIRDKKLMRFELGRNMRREHVTRQRSMAEFTEKQMQLGERILHELRQNGRPVTN